MTILPRTDSIDGWGIEILDASQSAEMRRFIKRICVGDTPVEAIVDQKASGSFQPAQPVYALTVSSSVGFVGLADLKLAVDVALVSLDQWPTSPSSASA
jgi:hypothetical protein